MKDQLTLTGSDLRLRDIESVILNPKVKIAICDEAMARVRLSRRVVEKAIERDEVVYGVNTGFGKLSQIRIPIDQLTQLQRNMLLSHATAVGDPMDPVAARIMLLLRINALVKGHSGVRPELIQTLTDMFNNSVIPIIPRQGSVGASGDLAPLAHMALVITGLGEAWFNGRKMSGGAAMRKARIAPLTLQPKEGLALINGTQAMTAMAAVTLVGAMNLARHADIAAAMSVEALKGTNVAFDSRIQEVRPFPHQEITAHNLRRLLSNSWILASHVDCGKVQDPYSLRCVPQVHGASRSALAHVKDTLVIEFNSANDNPLIFPEEGEILSGGNFHGQPIALAADYMGIAIAELANISERRTENLVNPELSGLPAFLAPQEGLDSGYMVAQVTAASLVSENKVLGHPASLDSIPTSANKEDHVSMGTYAAFKAGRILKNAEFVLAVEFLCAAQGLEYRGDQKPGLGVEAAFNTFRRTIPALKEDRLLSMDLDKARKLICSRRILRAVERKVGKID